MIDQSKKSILVSFSELKSSFLQDPNATIGILYKELRNDFIRFGRQYHKNDEDIIDSFQDAIIALHDNLNWGRIKNEKSTVKTYLFTIGKYKLLNRLKKDQRIQSQDGGNMLMPIWEPVSNDEGVKEKLIEAISKLGATCQKMLDLFYYKRYSIEAIQHHLGMKSENSVKANKSRCIKQLKEIYQSINQKEDE